MLQRPREPRGLVAGHGRERLRELVERPVELREGASSFDQKLDWCLESVETRGMFSETRCDLNCLNSCFGRGACNEDNTCRCFQVAPISHDVRVHAYQS